MTEDRAKEILAHAQRGDWQNLTPAEIEPLVQAWLAAIPREPYFFPCAAKPCLCKDGYCAPCHEAAYP